MLRLIKKFMKCKLLVLDITNQKTNFEDLLKGIYKLLNILLEPKNYITLNALNDLEKYSRKFLNLSNKCM